jgi:hypothetical protein
MSSDLPAYCIILGYGAIEETEKLHTMPATVATTSKPDMMPRMYLQGWKPGSLGLENLSLH